MRNHPNRSCAVAHRTLYAVQIASAKIDDLAIAYVVAHTNVEAPADEAVAAATMIGAIGVYRFSDQWPIAVVRASQLPERIGQ